MSLVQLTELPFGNEPRRELLSHAQQTVLTALSDAGKHLQDRHIGRNYCACIKSVL